MHVFIDESGVLSDAEAFCVYALALTHSKDRINLARLIKKVRRNLLHKPLHKVPEIKFNSSDKPTRRRVLGRLADQPVALYALIIEKDQGRVADTPVNNATAVAALVELIEPINDPVHVVVDKRYTRLEQRTLFDVVFHKRVTTHEIASITHATGQERPELQPVDFVAGALRQKHIYDNEEYVSIIQNLIVREQVQQWSELKQKKQQTPGG